MRQSKIALQALDIFILFPWATLDWRLFEIFSPLYLIGWDPLSPLHRVIRTNCDEECGGLLIELLLVKAHWLRPDTEPSRRIPLADWCGTIVANQGNMLDVFDRDNGPAGSGLADNLAIAVLDGNAFMVFIHC
jgi:hypothetical protein